MMNRNKCRCHVMEHESFESQQVASVMNASFVNIKVDREERPDVDKVYVRLCFIRKNIKGTYFADGCPAWRCMYTTGPWKSFIHGHTP